MARDRRTIGLVALAALAILGGTAATLFSGKRGADGTSVPKRSEASAADARLTRLVNIEAREPGRAASTGVLVLHFRERTPVAGAKVVLLCGPGRAERVTDSEGRAHFPDAISGQARIETTADGMEPDQRTADLRPGENPTVEILLVESALIEGRVLAAAGGAPIAGAVVTAGFESASGHYIVLEGGGHRRVGDSSPRGPGVVTGADGSFRMRAGRRGHRLVLETKAAGFATETSDVWIPADSGSGPVVTEIRLSRAGRIRGTIRDTRGRLIEGAAISAAPAKPHFRRSPGENSAADGSYLVDGLAVGVNYVVQSWGGAGGDPKYGGRPLSRPVSVYLPADTGEAVADLVLPIWGVLIVDWADPSGRSDGAARCLAFPLDAPAAPVETVSNRILGSLHLDIAEGRYRVVVDSELYGVGEVEAVVLGEAESRVRVTVGTAPALEGIVVDEEGRPVPGLRVRAMRPGDAPDAETPDPHWSHTVSIREHGVAIADVRFHPTATALSADALPGSALHARTDAAGRFRIDEVAPGTRWLLHARESDLSVEPAGPFQVPTREIRLVARRCGGLRGRLFLPAGAPVPAARSIHFETDTASTPGEPTLRTTGVFGDGTFVVEGLRPGKGRFWAASTSAHLRPVEVMVPAGEVADLGTLEMEPAYRLRGSVVDSLAQPRAFVWVHASGVESVRTDADGRFAFEGLRRGEVFVQVAAGPLGVSQATVTTARFTLPRPEGEDAPVEIRIATPGIVSGEARNAEGRPLGGWLLRARDASNPAPRSIPVGAVSPRGYYEVTLAPGSWVLSLHAPGVREAAVEKTVTLGDNGRATVDFKLEPE